MNYYIIVFDSSQNQFDQKKIHDMVVNHLSVTDWWHYLPNTYIVSTTVPIAGISSTVRSFFPGLLHFISKVDLGQTSGLLPKEAWEWINRKTQGRLKIKTQPRIKIQEPKTFTMRDLLSQTQKKPTKTGMEALNELLGLNDKDKNK